MRILNSFRTTLRRNTWSDLYAGAIQFMCVDLTAARGQVVARKVRTLAIPLVERSPLYPIVPTFAESFADFVSTGFLAIAVPKAVPDDVTQKLNVLINEAVLSPAIHKRLTEKFALLPHRLDLAQCAAQDRAERAKGRVRDDRADRATIATDKVRFGLLYRIPR